jgi:hypothetical protein
MIPFRQSCSRRRKEADSLRFRLRLLLLVSCLAVSALGQKQSESSVKTLDPIEGDREAKKLLLEILAQRPDQTFTNGLLKIRDREGNERKVPVRFQTTLTPTNWAATYDVAGFNSRDEKKSAITKAIITHNGSAPNEYLVFESGSTRTGPKKLPPEDTMRPFADSDFWLADLGLDFLHWPKQRVVKKEMYSSRYCAVLDSINPNPPRGAYARVRSWITAEPPHAPARAEAYDSSGKRIKVFDVKSIERVNGQFQVDAVEMRNLQTGSRTIMEFDLGSD